MKNIVITGTSSGLGKSLAKAFSESHDIYGISRSESKEHVKSYKTCDFASLESIDTNIQELTKGVNDFDYVILNAGTLGNLKKVCETSIEEYKRIFNINVWSNKVMLDYLLQNKNIKNVIAISSGAALKTYFGWSLYCTSKAAFKQLISSYADEYKSTRFVSLAPGLVKTKMQDKIYDHDENIIPSVKKFKLAYNNMESPDKCAQKIVQNINQIFWDSKNHYCDLRNIFTQ